MAIPAPQKATERMVVLLRPREKQRLQKLARKERVSSAEIVRRSLATYAEPIPEFDENAIAEMNRLLDETLTNIRSARADIQQTLTMAERRKATGHRKAKAA